MSDILILRYQAISSRSGRSAAVTAAALHSQLESLLSRGYQPHTFGAGISADAEKVLAVTFDGALTSVLTLGLPVLQQLGIPATVFVPTARIGTDADWPDRAAQAGPADLDRRVMSAEQLRSLIQLGWEVGTQGQTHRDLTELSDGELARELIQARKELAEHVGVSGDTLAYPDGACDARVIAAAADAGYVAAAGISRRWFGAPLQFNWPRVTVTGRDRAWSVAVKTSPACERHDGSAPRPRFPWPAGRSRPTRR